MILVQDLITLICDYSKWHCDSCISSFNDRFAPNLARLRNSVSATTAQSHLEIEWLLSNFYRFFDFWAQLGPQNDDFSHFFQRVLQIKKNPLTKISTR